MCTYLRQHLEVIFFNTKHLGYVILAPRPSLKKWNIFPLFLIIIWISVGYPDDLSYHKYLLEYPKVNSQFSDLHCPMISCWFVYILLKAICGSCTTWFGALFTIWIYLNTSTIWKLIQTTNQHVRHTFNQRFKDIKWFKPKKVNLEH